MEQLFNYKTFRNIGLRAAGFVAKIYCFKDPKKVITLPLCLLRILNV